MIDKAARIDELVRVQLVGVVSISVAPAKIGNDDLAR